LGSSNETRAADPRNGVAETVAKARTAPLLDTHDGVRLFYKEWGTGEPILFVHSWAMNSDLWQYQMLHLANQGLRCIAYDQRGHGRSSDPGTGYDFDTLSDDLATVIEQRDLRAVTLVGHSMGCGVIARYLTRHGGSRITRVALVAPGSPFALKSADNPQGVDKAFLDKLRGGWSKDFPSWLAANARAFFLPETPDAVLQWGISMCLQSSLKGITDFNRAGTETDFREELAKLTTPTLIIHGDKDVSEPIDFTGRRTAKLIQGSHLIVYEGAPHGLMLTHVDRLNADLLAFVRGQVNS
jgi:pimeloyl-ACP methyl ester carboxylesterase